MVGELIDFISFFFFLFFSTKYGHRINGRRRGDAWLEFSTCCYNQRFGNKQTVCSIMQFSLFLSGKYQQSYPRYVNILILPQLLLFPH